MKLDKFLCKYSECNSVKHAELHANPHKQYGNFLTFVNKITYRLQPWNLMTCVSTERLPSVCVIYHGLPHLQSY